MSDNPSTDLDSNLSKSPDTEGFDLQAGESWIYPTNYPVREYQFNIIQKALLKNTLVSLPTGLGKTFIAAVIMFNYFRWYPSGKIIFMAPTKPLVKQQIDACYDIVAIPREATAEITGTKSTNLREDVWNSKRVFFITPQILQNDLDNFQSLGPKIKCLVFDEAHRARGNHAYCEIIRKLSASNKYFRILALSATPGGTIESVLEVVQNLQISHLEFRTEESDDVKPYVFQRNLITMVVPLGEKLQKVKDAYMNVLESYTRTLIRYNVIQGNCGNLTKGKIFIIMKNFQQSQKGTSSHYGEIMKCLNVCITLYHALELLVRHGLRSFLAFYEEHIDKPLLKDNMMIRSIMNDIREYLGAAPQITMLPDGEYSEISDDVKYGHPKFYKLRDVLEEHFKESSGSRVIVFFEYRDSVMEAYTLLIKSKPIVRPRVFIGQKQGVTQKLQINVVKAFREGTCNVLLSTSIGEEGLDVGEVDLIICFDISTKSPIRMVQRMGRTGRKKDGKVIILVTEGKEQQTLKDCLIHKNNVAFHVLGSKQLANGLQKESPRLIPEGLVPKCEKMFVTVHKPIVNKKTNGNLKEMLRSLSSKSSDLYFSPNLEIEDIKEKIPMTELISIKSHVDNIDRPLQNIFSKRIEKQRSFQEIHNIQHSENCELLVNLLQMSESRRFNIPMSQINAASHSKNLKQTDIRSMFYRSESAKDFDLPTTQIQLIPNSLNIKENKNLGLPILYDEITNFLSISMEIPVSKCKFCHPEMNCGKYRFKNKSKTEFTWQEINFSLFNSITLNDLNMYEKSLDKSVDGSFQFDETLDIPDISAIELKTVLEEKNRPNFEPSKSFSALLDKYSTSIIDMEEVRIGKETENSVTINSKFSGDEIKEILNFFMLSSLYDIFEQKNTQIVCSPDLFEDSLKVQTIREESPKPKDIQSEDSNSPILCSYVRKSRVCKRTLTQNKINETFNSPSLLDFNSKSTSTPKSSKNFLNFETNINVNSNIPLEGLNKEVDVNKFIVSKEDNINEICIPRKNNQNVSLQLEDLFDFSEFGLNPEKKHAIEESGDITSTSKKESPSDKLPNNILKENENLDLNLNDFDKDLLGSITGLSSNDKRNDNKRDLTEKTNSKSPSVMVLNKLPENKTKCSEITEEKVLNDSEIISLIDSSEEDSNKISASNISLKENENPDVGLNITEFEDFFDKELLEGVLKEKPTSQNRNNKLEILNSKFPKPIKNLICDNSSKNTSSQMKITQMISQVNKPTQQCDLIKTQTKLSNSSQIGITQMLSLINKPTLHSNIEKICDNHSSTKNKNEKTGKIPNKDNIFEADDSDFDFSFITKKPTRKPQKSPNKLFEQKKPNDSSTSANSSKNSTQLPDRVSIPNSKLNGSNQISSSNTSKLFEQNKPNDSSISANSSKNSTQLTDRVRIPNSKLNGSNQSSSSNTSLRSKLNESSKNLMNTSISDDEFETKPESLIWNKPKIISKKRRRPIDDNSDDDFQNTVKSPISHKSKINIMPKKINVNKVHKSKKKKCDNQFIEDEAELSFCDKLDISEDESESENLNCYDESFVADETHIVNTQMHVEYLKSVRSPRVANKFKIPERMRNNINVFSQTQTMEDDLDIDESFVVDDDIEDSPQELSQLEILERKLEMQRKCKKSSRKRIIVISSDSD